MGRIGGNNMTYVWCKISYISVLGELLYDKWDKIWDYLTNIQLGSKFRKA